MVYRFSNNRTWLISPIIDKRLYLTLFDWATTSWVFTMTWKNTTWIFSDCSSLTTLYTHQIIEFSKTLIPNHFLLGLWFTKKNVKMYLYVKKVSAFWKKYYFSDRNARKYSNSKIDFKNVFSRVFRHFDSQFDIIFWKAETFLHETCNFQIGIFTGSQWFFTIDGGICCKSVEIK